MGKTSCNEYSSDRGSIKGKRLGDGPVGKNLIGQIVDSSRNYNKSTKIEEKIYLPFPLKTIIQNMHHCYSSSTLP